MSIIVRRYKQYSDFPRVSQFLRDNFTKYELGGNYCQSFWEYAHTHPAFNHKLTHRFGVWEEKNEIIGVAAYEMDLGEAFFSCKIGMEELKIAMIDYAESELSIKRNGKIELEIHSYNYEKKLNEAVVCRNYQLKCTEDVKVYKFDKGINEVYLPEGFSAISLEDENDIQKIHSVLWKGFDHGNYPDDNIDCRWQMQSGPSFSKELTTVIKAPNGDYACFAGMWMDGINDYAYLEPLATDPKYRKMGLASAALNKSMKKANQRGASYCIGGSGAFYTAIGFQKTCEKQVWTKK